MAIPLLILPWLTMAAKFATPAAATIGAAGLGYWAKSNLTIAGKISEDRDTTFERDMILADLEEERLDQEWERGLQSIYFVEKSKQTENQQRIALQQADMAHDYEMQMLRQQERLNNDAQNYMLSQAFDDFTLQHDPNEKYVLAYILRELRGEQPQNSPSLGETPTDYYTYSEVTTDPLFEGVYQYD